MKTRGKGNHTGRVCGPLVRVGSNITAWRPRPNCIAYMEVADVEIIAHVDSIQGIVVERGSLASHLAILSIELGIPFMSLVAERIEFEDGVFVSLDSNAGSLEDA